jgi:hypothetical protein
MYPNQSKAQSRTYEVRKKSKGGLEVFEEDSVRLLTLRNQLFLLANVAIALDPTKTTSLIRYF